MWLAVRPHFIIGALLLCRATCALPTLGALIGMGALASPRGVFCLSLPRAHGLYWCLFLPSARTPRIKQGRLFYSGIAWVGTTRGPLHDSDRRVAVLSIGYQKWLEWTNGKMENGKGRSLGKPKHGETNCCSFGTQHARTKHAHYGTRAVMRIGQMNVFGYIELVRARVAHKLRRRPRVLWPRAFEI